MFHLFSITIYGKWKLGYDGFISCAEDKNYCIMHMLAFNVNKDNTKKILYEDPIQAT